MSESSTEAGDPATPKRSGVASSLTGDVRPRTVVIVAVVGVVAFLAYTRGGSWLDQYQRSSVSRKETAPTELHGMRLGMSRMDVAKMFADSGVEWSSITKPGMMPSVWAAQQNVSINGFSTRQMSVRFADGVCWNYGAITAANKGVLDPKTLIGPLDPNSALTGIMWNFESTRPVGTAEIESRQVPLNVLNLLGSWHSEDKEITGFGRVYIWDWSDISAIYRTVDGGLQFQSKGAVTAAPVAAGNAGPAVPVGTVPGTGAANATGESVDPNP